jgi:hypothetical protein
MSSVAKIFKKNAIRYSPYTLNASETSKDFVEDLRREVGTERSSEWKAFLLKMNYDLRDLCEREQEK